MTQRQGNPDELRDLVAKVCNEELSPEEFARFEQLLTGDAEAQAFYVRYVDMHAALGEPALPLQSCLETIGEVSDQFPCDGAAFPSTLLGRSPSLFWALGTVVSAAVLVLLVALIVMVRGMRADVDRAALARSGREKAAPAPVDPPRDGATAVSAVPGASPSSPHVARLVHTQECRWGGYKTAPVAGDFLEAEQSLTLLSGRMEIAFDGGAKVVVEGPATFKLKSDNAGYLHTGRLVAKAPAGNSEFVISTPCAKVVDFGGSVALGVDSRANAMVQSLQNDGGTAPIVLVANRPSGSAGGGAPPQPLRLSANEMVRVDAQTATVSRVKPEEAAALADRLTVLAARPPRILMRTALEGAETWRYTIARPADDWTKADFDDSRWSQGKAGFGVRDEMTSPQVIGTPWKTPDIWLRKTIDVAGPVAFDTAALKLRHDDDVEVFVNGNLIFAEPDFNITMVAYDVTKELKTAIRPGHNVFAVHVHQYTGGQYIDLGLVLDPKEEPLAPKTDPTLLQNLRDSRWSTEKAWKWYAGVGPICGCNYVPRSAVNTTEMWQAETFDPALIDEELGWAEKSGLNSIRVFLPYIVYQAQPKEFLERMDRFLAIADRHHISVMFVLFDDCFHREPNLGKQPAPVPGVHNSQWTASPGERRKQPEHWPALKNYVQDVVGHFAQDRRVIAWDVYNEASAQSQPLVEAAFAWAREAKPAQPLTACWQASELCDVVSFHDYNPPKAEQLAAWSSDRPALCTECIARTIGSRLDNVLPAFAEQGIGWYMWGLVNGRTQTHQPWGSPPGAQEPMLWFHDLLLPDGRPYRPKEIEQIRRFPSQFKLTTPFPLCQGPSPQVKPFCLWIEAEDYTAQRGSTSGPSSDVFASGGFFVDSNWGGGRDHFLRYRWTQAQDLPTLRATIRYARHTAGDSILRLVIDGAQAKGVEIRLPSTGSWGGTRDAWKWASVAMPGTTAGTHTLEIQSTRDNNNVNLDGLFLSETAVTPLEETEPPPPGPSLLPSLGGNQGSPVFPPLACKTPLAAPYSRVKAYVGSDGRLQVMWPSRELAGIGNRPVGPCLAVMLDDHGPWHELRQRREDLVNVATRFTWPGIVMDETCSTDPTAPGEFRVATTLKNVGKERARFRVASILTRASDPTILEIASSKGFTLCDSPRRPGDGPALGMRCDHEAELSPGEEAVLELKLRGDDGGQRSEVGGKRSVPVAWKDVLSQRATFEIPDQNIQLAQAAAYCQMMEMMEPYGDGSAVRVLKGLETYYGSNPYDTFQVSRALDSVGNREAAEKILRHQLSRLCPTGMFEMWEHARPDTRGIEQWQWIVQGLAGKALWNHYQQWSDEAWLRDITPALVRAARATLKARRSTKVRQGNCEFTGLLPPCLGDGGLPSGYHWAQNAGPLAEVHMAAEAAKRLGLPEAGELARGADDFQRAFDEARLRAVAAFDGGAPGATPKNPGRPGRLPAFPGAREPAASRCLWTIVMSVSTFDAIPTDDPPALAALRFLQAHKDHGLHQDLGYSAGVWPYMSAEVAQWHARLGEFDEAWRILRAFADHASATGCWYEEMQRAPPHGFGDPADVWAAAEMLYLTRELLVWETADGLLLCPAMPADWQEEGKRVRVQDVPVPGGKVSYDIQFTSDGAEAAIRLTDPSRIRKIELGVRPRPGSEQRLHVTGAKSFRVTERGIVLVEPQSEVRLSWKGN